MSNVIDAVLGTRGIRTNISFGAACSLQQYWQWGRGHEGSCCPEALSKNAKQLTQDSICLSVLRASVFSMPLRSNTLMLADLAVS